MSPHCTAFSNVCVFDENAQRFRSLSCGRYRRNASKSMPFQTKTDQYMWTGPYLIWDCTRPTGKLKLLRFMERDNSQLTCTHLGFFLAKYRIYKRKYSPIKLLRAPHEVQAKNENLSLGQDSSLYQARNV